MNAEPFDDQDGFRVWLDLEETYMLISAARDREERLAFTLGLRSGLRVSEIVSVQAEDVVSTSAGPRVRVWHSKGKEYRETPTTEKLLAQAETVADLQGEEKRLVPRTKRWVQRHLDEVCEKLAGETGDDMWLEVTPHDLRRSWATLLSANVDDPLLICDWGGWEDLETFLEHYRGSYSPQVQRQELEKVDWLDTGDEKSAEKNPELSMLEEQSVPESHTQRS